MNWYPWLTEPYKKLVSQYRSQRPHHALLLHMPYQYGEELLVNAVGRWLMCSNPQAEKTCGSCKNCLLMKAGTHPDWHEIVPEANKSTLGIEQIRTLTETLYEHARQGGVKVAWIADASLLTESAANALLKTLEEPPANTYFLLACHEPNRLLATIRSRCLYWPLHQPDEAYSRQWLSKQHPSADPLHILTALRLTSGSPLNALNLLTTEHWQQRLSLLGVLHHTLQQNNWLALLAELNQDNVVNRLNWLISLYQDAMKWAMGAKESIVNWDQQHLVEQLAMKYSPLLLQILVQHWLSCRHQIDAISGVNKELLITDLLLRSEQIIL